MKTTMKKLLCLAGCALVAVATIPTATADFEAGGCVFAQCTWVDNNGNSYSCESNGNVAVIAGDDNSVNYCHDESNETASESALLHLD